MLEDWNVTSHRLLGKIWTLAPLHRWGSRKLVNFFLNLHLRGREARIKPRLAAQVRALLLGHSARMQYCPDDPPGAEGTSRVLGDGGRHLCLEMGVHRAAFWGGWDLGKEKLLEGYSQ